MTRRHGFNLLGFTLLEILIVLALLLLLSAMAMRFARPSHVWSAARGVRALLLGARVEALLGGSSMAFRYDAVEHAFKIWRGDACDAGRPTRLLRLREYPRVRLLQDLRDGLLWTPSGAGRDCGGGGVFNGALVLADGRRSVRVVVARSGRVRLEAAP